MTINDSEPLCRNLRVGDRVRLVEMPPEFARADSLQADTRDAYESLLNRRRAVRIFRVDKDGLPWIRFRLPAEERGWEWHFMALNHGGLVRVRPR